VSHAPPRIITLREPLTFTNGQPMSPSDIAVLRALIELGGATVRIEPGDGA
jgi:hypothetical protein